jgi:hypothetical protein
LPGLVHSQEHKPQSLEAKAMLGEKPVANAEESKMSHQLATLDMCCACACNVSKLPFATSISIIMWFENRMLATSLESSPFAASENNSGLIEPRQHTPH